MINIYISALLLLKYVFFYSGLKVDALSESSNITLKKENNPNVEELLLKIDVLNHSYTLERDNNVNIKVSFSNTTLSPKNESTSNKIDVTKDQNNTEEHQNTTENQHDIKIEESTSIIMESNNSRRRNHHHKKTINLFTTTSNENSFVKSSRFPGKMSNLLPDISEIMKSAGINSSQIDLINAMSLNDSQPNIDENLSTPNYSKVQNHTGISIFTKVSSELLNNVTSLDETSINVRNNTEKDLNYHEEVSKNKSKKPRLDYVDEDYEFSTRKYYLRIASSIEDKKTQKFEKHDENISAENLQERHFQKKTQKDIKLLDIINDNFERKVETVESLKQITENFVQQNPLFQNFVTSSQPKYFYTNVTNKHLNNETSLYQTSMNVWKKTEKDLNYHEEVLKHKTSMPTLDDLEKYDEVSTRKYHTSIESTIENDNTQKLEKTGKNIYNDDILEQMLRKRKQKKTKVLNMINDNSERKVKTMESLKRISENFEQQNPSFQNFVTTSKQKYFNAKVTSKHLNNETSLHYTSMNVWNKTEKDLNYHEEVSKHKTRMPTLDDLEKYNEVSTRKYHTSIESTIENEKTQKVEKPGKNISNDDILEQLLRKRKQKKTKHLDINDDNSERKVKLMQSIKQITENFVHQNPSLQYFVTSPQQKYFFTNDTSKHFNNETSLYQTSMSVWSKTEKDLNYHEEVSKYNTTIPRLDNSVKYNEVSTKTYHKSIESTIENEKHGKNIIDFDFDILEQKLRKRKQKKTKDQDKIDDSSERKVKLMQSIKQITENFVMQNPYLQVFFTSPKPNIFDANVTTKLFNNIKSLRQTSMKVKSNTEKDLNHYKEVTKYISTKRLDKRFKKISTKKYNTNIESTIQNNQTRKFVKNENNISAENIPKQNLNKTTQEKTKLLDKTDDNPGRKVQTMQSVKQIPENFVHQNPYLQVSVNYPKQKHLHDNVTFKLFSNITSLLKTSMNARSYTEKDLNHHKEVSKRKTTKRRLNHLEKHNKVSTKKNYSSIESTFKNNQTRKFVKNEKNISDEYILTQNLNKSTQKRAKLPDIIDDNFERKVKTMKSVKQTPETFVQHNPYLQDSLTSPKQKNNNSNLLDMVSNLVSDLSDINYRRSKSQNNNAVKIQQQHNKKLMKSNNNKIQFRVSSSNILKKQTGKFNYRLRSYYNTSKMLTSSDENKKRLKKLHSVAPKAKSIYTVYPIPTFAAIDSRLKFITMQTSGTKIKNKKTQTTRFAGLRIFSGPYNISATVTPYESHYPYSLKAYDTYEHDDIDKKSETIENDNKVFLSDKKNVVTKKRDLTNNLDVKHVFGKAIDDIIKGGVSHNEKFKDNIVKLENAEIKKLFEKEIKKEKALFKKIDVETSNETFFEVEDTRTSEASLHVDKRFSVISDENIDIQNDYNSHNELVTTETNFLSDVKILEDGKIKDRHNDDEIITMTDETNMHTPKWKRLRYVSSYSDEEELIKKKVYRAFDTLQENDEKDS